MENARCRRGAFGYGDGHRWSRQQVRAPKGHDRRTVQTVHPERPFRRSVSTRYQHDNNVVPRDHRETRCVHFNSQNCLGKFESRQ